MTGSVRLRILTFRLSGWMQVHALIHPIERTSFRLQTLLAALRHMPVRRAAIGGWQWWFCAEPVWGSACSTAVDDPSVARLQSFFAWRPFGY
jgi:hypothetical protein